MPKFFKLVRSAPLLPPALTFMNATFHLILSSRLRLCIASFFLPLCLREADKTRQDKTNHHLSLSTSSRRGKFRK